MPISEGVYAMYAPPTGSDWNGPKCVVVFEGSVTSIVMSSHLSPVVPAAVGGMSLIQKTMSTGFAEPSPQGLGAAVTYAYVCTV